MTTATGSSEQGGIIETGTTRLDLARALSIAQVAVTAAKRRDCLTSVAVCNREGRIIAFLKMDGTSALSGHEAMGRAIAAAGSGRPSEMVDDPTDRRSRVSTVENEGIGSSHQRGGLPLVHRGEEFGAVGVCGTRDCESDVACAQAATRAFQDDAAFQNASQQVPLG